MDDADSDEPSGRELPDELSDLIGSIATATGDLGLAAEVGWNEKTVAVIGQAGDGPTIDPDDASVMLDVVDSNLEAVLDDSPASITSKTRTDNGFRYEIDVDPYIDEPSPQTTRIMFDQNES